MARIKQRIPTQRATSNEILYSVPEIEQNGISHSNGHVKGSASPSLRPKTATAEPGLIQLLVCVGGIYASFLSWGLLQERITKTPYTPETNSFSGPTQAVEYFRFPIVLNTIQSLFALLSGTAYLFTTTGSLSILTTTKILPPILLITLTTTLASPFGYASLAHVDYLTFVLAKSCKLLPVMALHITLFGKRYPLSKYFIVLAVTGGVALFTLYHPPKPSTGKPKATTQPSTSSSSIYGLSLLGINLLFDGLTNTVQDHIFKSPAQYGKFTGPQMMVLTNLFSFILMTTWLLLTPYISPSSPLLPSIITTSSNLNELHSSTSFLTRHPRVLYDVLGFCFFGAVGQVFIFATLEKFSSLLLVTVTVTRKMLTMILSVVWYGHSLSLGQWMGVGLVFGGISAEAWIARAEKKAKETGNRREKVELKKL